MPVRIQGECRRLSSGFLHYDQSGEIPEGWACLTGCRNLDRALKHRPGDCPNVFPDGSLAFQDPNETSTPEAGHWLPVVSDDGPAGISMCTIDQTCPEELKCCNEHCVRPEFGKSVPDLVAVPQIVEEGKPRAFELSWNAGMSERDALMEPVIYLLQVRTYFGPEFDPMQASEWKTLTTTTIPGARLSDPDIGWWYQYRIAAVSPQGSRGFGDSSPPVRMTTQLPQPASPPLQLTDDIWRLHADGSVQVRLQWQPPMTASIPITEYHVCLVFSRSWGSSPLLPFFDTLIYSNTRTRMHQLCLSGCSITPPKRCHKKARFAHQLDCYEIISPVLETIHEATETFNCECEGARRSNNQQSRLFITSGFRSIRVDHHSAPDDTGGFSIRFANDPGVFDGQFLKTFLTINEFLEPSGRNQIMADEHISPRLLQLKWKPLACIETSAQVSKTFIPLKVSRANIAGKSSAGSYFTAEQSRFVVMEPVSTSALAPTRLIRSGRVEISPLQLNCHYSVFVVPDTEAAAQNLNKVVNDGGAGVPNSRSTRPPISAIQIGCLCTPACFDDQSLPWASHFSCINEGREFAGLLHETETKGNRLMGKTSLLLDSLMPGTVYIVTVQTLLFRGSRQEAFRSPQIPSGTSAASHGQDHIRAMPGRQLRHNSNSPASLQVSEEAFVYIQTPSLSEGRLGSLCNAAASLPLPIWNLSFLCKSSVAYMLASALLALWSGPV
ncbi:unnamed protein product [Schistocephalus solidus]|uniref:Fibronectin type-III domain-containing protein n=1 Tax=Schistocephalus solidus TaxID=70667 RepID=A0A183SD59_SCHSO|nr:unnamed protein product [Schistocephalus solidus]